MNIINRLSSCCCLFRCLWDAMKNVVAFKTNTLTNTILAWYICSGKGGCCLPCQQTRSETTCTNFSSTLFAVTRHWRTISAKRIIINIQANMPISPWQYHYVNPDLRVKTKREAGSFVGKTFSKQKEPPNSTCLISAHVTLSLYATSCKTSIYSQQTLMEQRTCLLFVVFTSLAFIAAISNVLYMSWSNSSIIYIRGE